MLPSLKYLDSADVNNEEVDDSDIENDLDNNGVGGGEDDEDDDDDDDDLDDEELDEEDDEEEENQGPTGGKAGATEEVCNNEMLSLYLGECHHYWKKPLVFQSSICRAAKARWGGDFQRKSLHNRYV